MATFVKIKTLFNDKLAFETTVEPSVDRYTFSFEQLENTISLIKLFGLDRTIVKRVVFDFQRNVVVILEEDESNSDPDFVHSDANILAECKLSVVHNTDAKVLVDQGWTVYESK